MSKKVVCLTAVMAALAALSFARGAAHYSRARVVSVPALVTSPGDAARDEFMRKVHDAQVKRARDGGREYFPGLPDDRLEDVESRHRMRRDAAGQCRLLLEQARSELKRQQEAGIKEALEVSDISVYSAYRDIERDRTAWHNTFEKHFKATKDERAKLEGGEYGDKAVELMVGLMRKYKAAPGFSRHTSGVAVDFKTTEGSLTLNANSNQNGRWKQAWFHKWLVRNAARFKFKPLSTEAWHWDYAG